MNLTLPVGTRQYILHTREYQGTTDNYAVQSMHFYSSNSSVLEATCDARIDSSSSETWERYLCTFTAKKAGTCTLTFYYSSYGETEDLFIFNITVVAPTPTPKPTPTLPPASQRNYQVGSYYYRYLSNAYDSITGTSGTIKVLKDVTDSTSVYIDSGKTITLDTNGKTITRTGNTHVAGTLTLVGTGKITRSDDRVIWVSPTGTLNINQDATTIEGVGQYAIHNGGTVNSSKGIITSNGPHVIYLTDAGTLNISGGRVTNTYVGTNDTSSRTAIYSLASSTTDTNIRRINISGSALIETSNTQSVTFSAPYSNTGGTAIFISHKNTRLNITGGTISGDKVGINASSTTSVTIGSNDGTINVSSPIIRGYYEGIRTTSTITFNFYDGVFQGTFDGISGDKTPSIPSGTRIVTDTASIGDTTYKRAYLADNGIYQIGSTTYNTLESAVAAVSANGTATIKVIKNGCDPSQAGIYNGKTITLDTNGKTVTRPKSIIVNDTVSAGTLNIVGNGTIYQPEDTPAIKVDGGVVNINTDATNITGDIVDWRTCTSSRGYI